ncbi:MAG: hypothetical protein HYW48_12555 [Deltaproteobacteria bacterium]|nr:hypothetical protein [Deltaproteobacteria bacterium]
MTKKLDTFVLKDKFSLSVPEIFEEAQASSQRRAEMMGWVDISVVRTSDPSFTEGEFTCYTFDLLGTGAGFQHENEDLKTTSARPKRTGIAARKVEA